MNPPSIRRADHVPVLLIVSALGVWLLVAGSFVAALPDCVASADQDGRMAWTGY